MQKHLQNMRGWQRGLSVVVCVMAIIWASGRLYRFFFPGYVQGWYPHAQLSAITANETKARQLVNRGGVGPFNAGVVSFAATHAPRFAKQFVPAAQASIDGNTTVMGVCQKGQCKAYEVGWVMTLQVINDVLGDQPIAVTA
jgi:hypothetical protein